MGVISVVIPTKNAGRDFRQTLDAVLSQEIDSEIELIVIDSGSEDGTLDLCSGYPLTLLEIPPAEFGHGRTRNLAIAKSRGEFVALLVQDAVPAGTNWLSNLIAPLRVDDRLAGSFSKQLPRLDSDYVSHHTTRFWHNYAGGRIILEMPDKAAFDSLPADQKLRQVAFNNVSSMVRRSVWTKFPFPDVLYAEDVAWALKVIQSGYRLVYEPSSVVIHSHQRSWRHDFQRSYLEGYTLAQLFNYQMTIPTAHEFERIIRLLVDKCQDSLRRTDGQFLAPEPVRQAEQWFRQQFDVPALLRLLSNESSWEPDDGQDRVSAVCRFLNWQDLAPKKGISPRPGITTVRRLWAKFRYLWLWAFVNSRGNLPMIPVIRERIFSAFWMRLGWQHIHHVIMEGANDQKPPLNHTVAIDFWDTASRIRFDAQQENVALTPQLLSRLQRFSIATTAGKWLGRVAYSIQQSNQLKPPLLTIHEALIQGDKNWDLKSLLS